MSLWKWVVLGAFVAVAAVLAVRKFKSLRAHLLAQLPPPGERPPGNTWGARRHLNPHDESAGAHGPEPLTRPEERNPKELN